MLLRNGLSSNSSPLTLLGIQGWHFFRDDQQLFKNAGGFGLGKRMSIPHGHGPYNALSLPKTAGDMSFYAAASGTMTGTLIPSYPMSINLTGAGSLAATGALIVSMLLAMSGQGSLSASITGYLNMSCDLDGNGDLEAGMEGIASMMVGMLGEGTIEATIAAYGNMEIDMVVTGAGLTTSNVGAAVWGAIASQFTDSATMGGKLNTASSGGVDLNALADAVWSHADAIELSSTTIFLLKVVTNKKAIVKVDGSWFLKIYDDNGTTEILSKALKDKDGYDISDLAAGILARELENSV